VAWDPQKERSGFCFQFASPVKLIRFTDAVPYRPGEHLSDEVHEIPQLGGWARFDASD